MQKDYYMVISSKVLPPVFKSVITAKKLLADGHAKNTSDAVKQVGISRSAFYKYKDYVYKYEPSDKNALILTAVLFDKSGVLSALTGALSSHGANILTVNQSAPRGGKAAVTIKARTDNTDLSVSELIDRLKAVDGVVSIEAGGIDLQ